MVGPLLDQFGKAYPEGRAGYGKRFVLDLLYDPYEWPEILEMVFDRNLVAENVKDGTYSEDLTFLIMVAQRGDYQLAKRFISAGSNVNTILRRRDSSISHTLTTALLDAIDAGSTEIVQLLIESGANVNEPARFGLRRTPLQKAAEMNNIPIIHLLLNSNADVNAAPAKFVGATALQFAAIHGNCEMATILIEHGARQDIPPPDGLLGRYPLEGAAENGRFDMIELLWNAPRVSFDAKQCQKARRLAERNGHFGCKEKIEELMATEAQVLSSIVS